MRKLLSLLVFVTGSVAGFAQGQSGGSAGASSPAAKEAANSKITGVVLDNETQKPVEFATVALTPVDSEKPLDGTVCDDKGRFTITKVAAGTYNLVISFIGYETQTIKNISVPDKKDEVNVGVVKLSTGAKVLNEVVVEGQKALIEERVDRTIYNAENDQTARGGDATDVLKRVPMLSVDLDGNVSMRGSSNVLVLINNKPSTIMASSIADALKQIPADQIKSVEVITSPSAKYDAEGSAGIINIVTKKNTLEGLTMNIDAGLGLRGSNLGLNGNYRRGKMGFSLGGWGRANYNVNGKFSSDQYTKSSLDDTTPTYNMQRADTRNSGIFGNYNFGWDYDINEKNYMAASVRFGARNGKNHQDDLYTMIDTLINDDTNPVQSSLRNTVSEDLSNNVDVNLSFTHLYEKPQRELSLLGSYSRNNRQNNFENLIRQVNGADSYSGIRNDNDSYNQEMTFQIDYQSPIGTNQMIEFGAKDIMRKVFSEFAYFTDEDGDGNYIPSTSSSLSNNLNYNQNVVGGYMSYTYTTKTNYSIKAGTRYEYTTIDAYSQTEENIEIPSYGALVPSINVSKKLANGKTIKAAYNRRIQRPSIRYLNPNIQAQNPYDVSYGNPSLDPEYTNNYEMGYSTFIKGTSLNFSAFWRNTNNAIQDVRTVETESGIQRVSTTYENIGQEDAVGVNIFANVSIGKLSLNGGTDLYYSMLNNNVPDPQSRASNEGWVASYRMFGNYNLSKGWGFQFFGFYRGRQVQLQGTQGGFGIYSLGLKKDLKNKKGSVGFGAENFFTTAFKIKGELNSPLVQRNTLTELHNMSFRVNFSYRIGKMSMDAKPKRRKSISNDDLKEGDGGGGGGADAGGQSSGGGNFRQGQGAAQAAVSKPVNTPPVDTAAVVNAVGNWEYTIDSPQGGGGTLNIAKEGEVYSGTIKNNRFNSENKLSDVKLNGNELTFSYEVNMGGNQMLISVKAIITGDALTGNMTVGQFGTFPINAKRAAQ
jgi:outer membrane receptor protein involved in Fe transport